MKRADGPNPPVPRQANTSVTEQLIEDIIAAGGSLRLPRKHYYDREGVDYENRATLAERYGKVPDGKHLAIDNVSSDEIEIRLVDAPKGAELRPVPVPANVARYHAVVKQFRAKSERHEISRAQLPRASRILQGLVLEAERRGHAVELAPDGEADGYRRPAWSGSSEGHIAISTGHYTARIRITEEGLPSRANWEKKNRTYDYYGIGEGKWKLPPLTEYEAKATGRLTVELASEYGLRGRPVKWSDRQSWTLEESCLRCLAKSSAGPWKRKSNAKPLNARQRNDSGPGKQRWTRPAGGTPRRR